jgi:hypothetical protein
MCPLTFPFIASQYKLFRISEAAAAMHRRPVNMALGSN